MENRKQQFGGSSSSSSFTETLFGPKDSSPSTSSGIFSTVFGPASTGLGKDSAHNKYMGSSKRQDLGTHYGSPINGTQDYSKNQRSKGEKDRNQIYQNETAEPSYLSSSIYYGGQEVYSPNGQTTHPQPIFKKDGGEEDPNGSGASRGNWWQGSLYY